MLYIYTYISLHFYVETCIWLQALAKLGSCTLSPLSHKQKLPSLCHLLKRCKLGSQLHGLPGPSAPKLKPQIVAFGSTELRPQNTFARVKTYIPYIVHHGTLCRSQHLCFSECFFLMPCFKYPPGAHRLPFCTCMNSCNLVSLCLHLGNLAQ